MKVLKIIAVLYLVAALNPVYANDLTDQSCAALLESDIAYIKQNIEENSPDSPISPEIGGPVDILIADILKPLHGVYKARLKRKYALEFVNFCNGNGAINVSDAITELAVNLKLDMSAENWGMKEIDTDRLLNSTCQDFVSFIQENGIGAIFYNDPAQATLATYWAKFDAAKLDPNIIQLVEGDAQLACSWEPETKLIDVLDTIARDYQLERVN